MPENQKSLNSPPTVSVRQRQRIVQQPHEEACVSTNTPTQRLAVDYLPIKDIKAYSKRLRKHDEKHVAACMGSLRAFGFVSPILVDRGGTVIDGHALLIAAQRLGFNEIPVVHLQHLTPEQVQACRLALNKLAEGGHWDIEALQVELIDITPALAAFDIEVEAIGFSQAEFDLLTVPTKPAAPEEESCIETAELAVTQLGDVWLAGEHRLMCGNALSADDFTRLMAGSKARMSFCDPPYNLKVDGVISGLGKHKHREFAMGSGEMSRPDFIEFLSGYMRNCAAHSLDGSIHYACMDWRHIPGADHRR